MEKITSLQNGKIKKWMKLYQKKERDASNLFLVEGEHLVHEALQKEVIQIIITDDEEYNGFQNTVYVTKEVMKKMTSSKSGEHIIAVCHKVDEEIKRYNRLLLLDGIQDPGNLGTIIRTALSFGFDGIYCSKDTCDIYNEKAIRSSEGAIFHIPVLYTDLEECIKQLKQDDVNIIATALQNADPLQQLQQSQKMAIILGNEGSGIRQSLIDNANQTVKIEMEGFESLNVAVAAGIVMYHISNHEG